MPGFRTLTETVVRTRAAAMLRVIIVLSGVLVVGLVTLTSAAFLGQMVDNRWREFPGEFGLRGVVAVALPLLAVGSGTVALRRASEGALERWTPVAPLSLLVLLRLGAIVLVPTPIPVDNDPRYLHELAVGVLDGGNPIVSHRPMGYSTMLAGLYAVFGVHPVLAEVLNLAAATVAGWLLFILADVGWGRRSAASALFLYAVVPSQILLTTTIFTETLYSAVLLGAIVLATAGVATSRPVIMAASGVVLAISQYVRPLSQSFLPIFLAIPFLVGLRWSRACVLAIVLAGSFLVVMAPIVVRNLTVHGDLSLSTSSYAGWSLFVGANQEHDGRFNRDDQAILRETPGRSVWDQSETLGQAGIARITSDPGAFVDLAVRKFRVQWADDSYGVVNAFPGWDPASLRFDALRIASQSIYVLVVSLAAIGLWRMRQEPSAAVLLIAGILVVVAAVHLFVEVQPRYHAYVVPLLCVLAGPVVAGWRPERVDRAPDVEGS